MNKETKLLEEAYEHVQLNELFNTQHNVYWSGSPAATVDHGSSMIGTLEVPIRSLDYVSAVVYKIILMPSELIEIIDIAAGDDSTPQDSIFDPSSIDPKLASLISKYADYSDRFGFEDDEEITWDILFNVLSDQQDSANETMLDISFFLNSVVLSKIPDHKDDSLFGNLIRMYIKGDERRIMEEIKSQGKTLFHVGPLHESLDLFTPQETLEILSSIFNAVKQQLSAITNLSLITFSGKTAEASRIRLYKKVLSNLAYTLRLSNSMITDNGEEDIHFIAWK